MKRQILLITFDIYRPDYPTINYSIASIMATLKENKISFSHYSINISQYVGIDNQIKFDMIGLNTERCNEKIPKQSSFNTAITNELLDSISYFKKFEYIAIGVTRWSIEHTNTIIELLGDYKGKIILGGYEITAISETDLQKEFPRVDYFIKGYAEKSLVQLINNQQKSPTKVIFEPLDNTFLFSPYSSGILNITTRKIYWETKRGCSFACGFCEWGNAQIGMIELDENHIQKDIEFFKNSNVDEINILDGTFNSKNDYQKILLQLINNTDAKITFQARFEILTNEFLKFCSEYKERLHLEFGLQTIHKKEMEIIGRTNNMNVISTRIDELNQYEIDYEVSIIYAIPEQTVESFIDTIEFLRVHKCKKIKAYPLQVPRNSELEHKKQEYQITFQKEKYNVQTVSSSISFQKENRKDMDNIADMLNVDNPYFLLVEDHNKQKIKTSQFQYKMSSDFVSRNIKSFLDLISHNFLQPTCYDIYRYSTFDGMATAGHLIQITTNDYINYATEKQSIDYKNLNNGEKPEPIKIKNRIFSYHYDESVKSTRFYCKLVIGKSGYLYIYRRLVVEKEEKNQSNVSPFCGDPFEIPKGKKNNYERKKNIAQKQWLISVSDNQRTQFKDYIINYESANAIIKKFNHTYQNIDYEKIKKIIANNKHITNKEKKYICTLTDSMVMTFLHSPKLEYIEYSEIGDEKRILIRDNSTVLTITDEKKEKIHTVNLCIVFNLEQQRIITSYFNEINDKHYTRSKLKLESAITFNATFEKDNNKLNVFKKETVMSSALKKVLKNN